MTSSPEPTAPTEPAAAGQRGPTPPTGWAPSTAWAPPSGPPAPPPGSGWTAPGPGGPYPGWSAQPGGQAGYSQPPAARRRRRWRTALVAVPALLVVAAASSLITAQVVSGPTRAEKHAGAGTAKTAGDKTTRHATTGVVTSEDGSRWVVKTSKGTAVSIDVGSSTSFGSKHDPSQASAFHLGSTVKVVGPRTGSTVDAKRVTLLPATTPSAGASPSTSGAAG